MESVTLGIAFIAGLVSFLSPCVLPIIPGFLAYLAGTGTGSEEGNKRFRMFLASLWFVIGFSSVFALLGVLLNGILTNIAGDVQSVLAKLGGLLIIAFGLYLTGLVNVPFLNREYKFGVKRKFSSRALTSFLFGAAFAAGWTPCVGAVLGSIIALATVAPGLSFALFFAYSLGLGLPFLAVGLFAESADRLIQKYAKTARYVNIVFGALLIILGILAFTENLSLLFNLGFVNELVL